MVVLKKRSISLLKKSYDFRKVLDIFSNSYFVCFLHLDKYVDSEFDKFKKHLFQEKYNVFLLNKDRVLLNNDFYYVAKGPTFIVNAENVNSSKNIDNFMEIIKLYKISYEILLIKNGSYFSYLDYINFKKKYENFNYLNTKVRSDFFNLLTFYKILLIRLSNAKNIIFKFLIFIFYYKIRNFFGILNFQIERNKR